MARKLNHARLSAYNIKMFIFSSYILRNKHLQKNWIRIKRNLLLTFKNFPAYLVHHSHQFPLSLE